MVADDNSENFREQSLVDTILVNDSIENLARRDRGELPIVFRGTRKDRVKTRENYAGTYGETYFGYDFSQARSFAQINGRFNSAAIIRVDLQKLSQLADIDIELRDNDIVIRGGIPKEYMDIFAVS